jgi:hypothetical protein
MQKKVRFSSIMRVILSSETMLIFSVYIRPFLNGAQIRFSGTTDAFSWARPVRNLARNPILGQSSPDVCPRFSILGTSGRQLN